MTTQKKRLKEHAKELVSTQRSFIESLIALRSTSGMTQQDVANLMGVSQSAVSLFEHYDSNPTLASIRRYALAVNADLVMQVKPRRTYTTQAVVRDVNVMRPRSVTRSTDIRWEKSESKTLENA